MALDDFSTLTVEQCRKRQKVLRQKITGCGNRIRKIIDGSLSRHEAKRLSEEARTLLGETSPINDRLLELLEEDEGATQQDQFLRYGGDVDTMPTQWRNTWIVELMTKNRWQVNAFRNPP